MPEIRCVMFDFGNVLGIFQAPILYEFLLKNRGNCLNPNEMFQGPLLDAIHNYDAGDIDDSAFFSKIQQAFQLRNVTFGEFFHVLSKTLTPDWQMLELVRGLRKKGVATVLVSNMNSFSEGNIRERFPVFLEGFDYSFISHKEGVIKPNPEAWIRPLDFMGLKPEECIFVDDWLVNIEAACRLGIKGWYYQVSGEFMIPNERFDEERLKLKNFLNMLWEMGILKPYHPIK